MWLGLGPKLPKIGNEHCGPVPGVPGPGKAYQKSKQNYLSEDPGLTTYFFPGRDGVGGGGYPDESSSSSSTDPWDYQNFIFLNKTRKSNISRFRTDFLVKNNPRRVRRRLAQRLYPVQRPKSTGIIKI